MLEDVLFRKCVPNYDKLISYGFQKVSDQYIFTKKIQNNSFKVSVVIGSNHSVKTSVYDLEMDDEYYGYRVENASGEFAGKIREDVCLLLEDIRNMCFSIQSFVGDQANRISQRILKKYGDYPSFEWDQYPDFGVFKNHDSKKWYALIMNISKNKLGDDANSMVDVLNVKINPNRILSLLGKDGYYPAYHMNKKYWISVILDDSLSDDDVFSLIEESYGYTISNRCRKWIIPANPKYYDIENAFENSNIITWKQSSDIQVGDIVYIYVGAPVSALLYKCKVLETRIPFEYSDSNVHMDYVMKIELLEKYEKDLFPFSVLKECGVKAIRGPRSITKELLHYISKKKK